MIFDRSALFFLSLLQLTHITVVLAVLLLLSQAARPSPLPTNCSEVYRAGSSVDGVYTIYPAGSTSPVQVYCNMSGDGIDDSAAERTVRMKDQTKCTTLYLYL